MERVTVRMARSDRRTPWGFGVTEAPDGAVLIVNVSILKVRETSFKDLNLKVQDSEVRPIFSYRHIFSYIEISN